MLFGCCLVAANIASSKLVNFFGITLTGGMLAYSITYCIGDIITEVYGYKRSRQLIWGALISNLIVMLFIYVSIISPPADSWKFQKEFSHVLLGIPKVIFASMISYFASEFLNSYVLAKLKIFYGGQKLWFRIVCSTLVAMTVDNFLFLSLAFYGFLSAGKMLEFAFQSYILSLLFEWSCIPLIKLISNKIKTIEKCDIYDTETNFTPFSLDVSYE